MNEFSEKVSKIVEEALEQKVFSVETLEKIKKLRVDYDKVLKENEKLNDKNDKLNDKFIKLESDSEDEIEKRDNKIATLEDKLSNIKARLKGIKNRENLQTIVEIEKQEAEKRADLTKELFEIVFKNPVVRTTVQKTVPIVHPANPGDQYGNYRSNEWTEDRNVREETTVEEQ